MGSVIHYHGTPISGTTADSLRFLKGRHALISYMAQNDVGVAAEVCQSFVFDNGAFSVWKRGEKLDVPGYVSWVSVWHRHPGFDWALIPDVIDGEELENDALVADWPKAFRGVPVWHLHESIDRLVRLANEWPTVALGSSGVYATPGRPEWWERMRVALSAVCDDQGRPICRLHGLRMLDPKIFTRLPLSSADSTNAGLNCNARRWDKAIYKPPTAGQRAQIIGDRVEAFNSAPCFERGAGEWVDSFMADAEDYLNAK